MKVSLDISSSNEEEIVIKCKENSPEIEKIKQLISNITFNNCNFTLYKDNKEFFISVDEIVFFQTEGNMVNAHTIDDIFEIKYKLYKLENILPCNFVRISKSTIVNINYIYSINKNITSSSEIQFFNSYKKVYVSRMYYGTLKEQMRGRV